MIRGCRFSLGRMFNILGHHAACRLALNEESHRVAGVPPPRRIVFGSPEWTRRHTMKELQNARHHNCRVEALDKWMMMHPLRISDSMQSGISGRDGCTQSVGPHKSKDRMQMRRQSRVSRAGCTHAQQSGQSDYRIQDTRMAIAPYGDRRCSSHLSHHFRSMYEET